MSSWKTLYPKFLHVELSTFCNAACPICPRYYEGTETVRPDLKLTQITLDKFKEYFSEEFFKQAYRILFCGTMGDPIMSKDCLEIFQHIYNLNPKCTQVVHTNGGMRDTEFWKKMGNLFQHRSMTLVFSIDGLEDTNHLYRRNVNWKTLMNNVQAFNDAGGRAIWDYLVFKHNEHQVDEAREISRKLGFVDFRVKRAIGFDDYSTNTLMPRAAFNRNGDFQYKIFPPTLLEYQNNENSLQFVDRIINIDTTELNTAKELKYFPRIQKGVTEFNDGQANNLGQYGEDLNGRNIECNSHFDRFSEVYVNAEGVLFPCCFVGTRFDGSFDGFVDRQLKSKIGNRISELDLNVRNLTKIIESGALDSIFTDSWKKESIKDGKLAMCAETCGNKKLMSRLHVNEL